MFLLLWAMVPWPHGEVMCRFERPSHEYLIVGLCKAYRDRSSSLEQLTGEFSTIIRISTQKKHGKFSGVDAVDLAIVT